MSPKRNSILPCGQRANAGRCRTMQTGIAALVGRLQAVQPTLMVLEATGGSHRAVVAALAAAALPLVVVNPRQVRDCAKATGQLAKTDALDARAVAPLCRGGAPCAAPAARHADRRAAGTPSTAAATASRCGRQSRTASKTRRRVYGPTSWPISPGSISMGRPWMTTGTRRDGQAPSGASVSPCTGVSQALGRGVPGR